jgi:cytochrome P450
MVGNSGVDSEGAASIAAFDPYAPSSTERLAAMAAARAAGGVTETSAGYYVATAAGVQAGLRDVEKFVGSFMDTSGLAEEDTVVSAIPEPRHGRIRRIINTVIAVHRTIQAEPFIRTEAGRLVDTAVRAAASGPVDLVAGVVDPLPSTVIAHMLGVPVDHQERFRVWSDELLEAQSAGVSAPLADFHPAFAAYIQQQIDQRRTMTEPPDDIITRFLLTDVEGEFLSDAAICTQTMNLIIAGNETTRNLIGNCLYTLATSPDLYARVRADRQLVPNVVEESLRFDAPVQVLGRAVLADTEIEGFPLGKGDRVVFGLASANRDERVHDEPDEFRLDRPRVRDHVAFGYGPHICPGASLARLETVAVLETFCDRVAEFRLIHDFEPEPNPVFWAHGHRRLPAILTPAR